MPLLPFFPGLWPLAFAILLSMCMNTTAMLCLFRSSLPKGGGMTVLRYLFQCVFTPLWMTLLTLLGFFRVKINWKGSPVP
jgi:hypothetical protein